MRREDVRHLSFLKGYLETGYFDSRGNLQEKFITEWAEEIAKNLGSTKKHAIRRFYNHVKALERKLDLVGEYEYINADLKKLIPMASYATNRETVRISPLFEEFIRKNLEKVNNKKTFYAFVNHFEAIICYCEKYLRD